MWRKNNASGTSRYKAVMASKDGHRSAENYVPKGWKRVRLGDVAEIAFSGVDKKTVDGEIPVELCNYTDVFYSRRIHAGMVFMAATATPVEHRRWTLRAGDVLFTKDSETPDEIGIPSYVTEDMPHVLCGYHLALARPRPNVVDGAFLAEALGSNVSKREFARVANGVTRFGLTLGATAALPILLPPLPEQRAIAAVLDSIDEAIERTEAVIAATEQLRDSLLHELLTRGVPGWHTEWKDVPGLGTIPADWDVVRLGDVLASTTYGTNVSLDGNGSIPVLRMNNLQNGAVDLSDLRWTTVPDENLRDLDLVPGDILFNRTNSLDLVGKVAVVRELPQPITFASYLVRLRANDALLNPYWLGALLSSQDWQSRIQRFATPAVSRANINPTSLKTLALPLPLLPEQQAMTEVLDGVDKAIGLAYEERECMQAFQASAADALLTGQVRILEDGAVENG